MYQEVLKYESILNQLGSFYWKWSRTKTGIYFGATPDKSLRISQQKKTWEFQFGRSEKAGKNVWWYQSFRAALSETRRRTWWYQQRKGAWFWQSYFRNYITAVLKLLELLLIGSEKEIRSDECWIMSDWKGTRNQETRIMRLSNCIILL